MANLYENIFLHSQATDLTKGRVRLTLLMFFNPENQQLFSNVPISQIICLSLCLQKQFA